MELTRTLEYGMSGDDVKYVQAILKQQGYFNGACLGNFKNLTKEAVLWFQMTHIYKGGQQLDVDGKVGSKTWWALHNASGNSQRNFIDPMIPDGIVGDRFEVLSVGLEEYRTRVHEVPDGSNWGDGVTKYGGNPGWAWCCLFVSWVYKQAVGKYPFGQKQSSTWAGWQYAQQKHIYHARENYTPIPGDMFLMQYKDTHGNYLHKGHIGFVLAVDMKKKKFNTVEGNSGNRVKVGVRGIFSNTMIGFISPYTKPEDINPKFKQGLLNSSGVVNTEGLGTI